MDDQVLFSVDPHKASATVVVLDPVTRTPVETAKFPNTVEGYGQLRRFARRWSRRWWAVEGCHGAGRSLAQRLVSDGERVVDVPAKLAARIRVFSQGHGRKTDRHDAVSIGLAALDGVGLQEVRLDDEIVTLRLLCDRRAELVGLRTQAVCRLHRLLAELTPGGMQRELTATKASAVLVRLRPKDEPGRIRRQVALDHLGDVRALDRRINQGRRGGQRHDPVGDLRRRARDRGPDPGRGRRRRALRHQGPVRVLQRHGPDRRVLGRANPPSAVAIGKPPAEPRAPHGGGDPAALPRQRRAPLLRTEAPGGQDAEGSAEVLEATPLRRRLSAADDRQVGDNRTMRVTYDPGADAVYISLTEEPLSSGRDSVPAAAPPGVDAFVVLDWKGGRLVGIEILDARSKLHSDFLEQAQLIG